MPRVRTRRKPRPTSPDVKLIAGLGNPGKAYVQTPHNIGANVVRELCSRLQSRLRRSWRFKARTGDATWQGESLLLVEPLTFMNLSGNAVGAAMRYRKLTPHDLVVVLDDVDLELGRIRIKPSGGTGGHRGLGSVVDHLGTDAFLRVRVGVGRHAKRDVVEHVLRPFGKEELSLAKVMIRHSADAVLRIVDSGHDAAMNAYNGTMFDAGDAD
jgi:PTH1 family peptidyl-tRNA hydrolase